MENYQEYLDRIKKAISNAFIDLTEALRGGDVTEIEKCIIAAKQKELSVRCTDMTELFENLIATDAIATLKIFIKHNFINEFVKFDIDKISDEMCIFMITETKLYHRRDLIKWTIERGRLDLFNMLAPLNDTPSCANDLKKYLESPQPLSPEIILAINDLLATGATLGKMFAYVYEQKLDDVLNILNNEYLSLRYNFPDRVANTYFVLSKTNHANLCSRLIDICSDEFINDSAENETMLFLIKYNDVVNLKKLLTRWTSTEYYPYMYSRATTPELLEILIRGGVNGVFGGHIIIERICKFDEDTAAELLEIVIKNENRRAPVDQNTLRFFAELYEKRPKIAQVFRSHLIIKGKCDNNVQSDAD